MKWTIHELIKKAKTENDLEFALDLNHFITEELEDVSSILSTEVTGFYEYDELEKIFYFDLRIQTTLTMLCALTLKEVPVALDFTSQLNFSLNYIDDDTHVIDGITIDIDQYIFSEILIEKPMKVYSPHAKEEYEEEIYVADEEDLLKNSPFAKIKK